MDADVQHQAEQQVEPPPASALLMATVRTGEVRIGPTLNEVVEKVSLGEGEEPDEALERAGWVRRHDWRRDGAGRWALVARP